MFQEQSWLDLYAHLRYATHRAGHSIARQAGKDRDVSSSLGGSKVSHFYMPQSSFILHLSHCLCKNVVRIMNARKDRRYQCARHFDHSLSPLLEPLFLAPAGGIASSVVVYYFGWSLCRLSRYADQSQVCRISMPLSSSSSSSPFCFFLCVARRSRSYSR